MKEAEELLEKYKAGLCTSEEVQLLYKWFHHLGEDDVSELSMEDLMEAKLKFERNITGSILPSSRYTLWPRIAVAAAAIAAITLGTWLYYGQPVLNLFQYHPDPTLSSRVSRDLNDIAPGKNTATLTLADGKVINLDTNKTSVVVADSVKTMTMLTASTPRGGTYQVTLPDGSHVWLNADSKISFPSQFIGAQRKIILSGEAYFEVSKNKAKPFIVETRGQRVTVLGTHFNINSYADEGSTKTTLLEGSVKINDATILKPNQQSIITGDNQIKVKEVDAADAVLWKLGKFSFASEDIGSIMKQVERWYDVEVIYNDEVQKIKLSGSVSRFANLSVLLSKLQKTGLVNFKVEGRKLYVSR